ncbi:amino acid ABC transporter substrate-binding protein, PAAT family [Bosea lathyri]|jgi:polar amino acid transport system substrate-binding protein|uniref:Amino acid ABC transporter substrate-binding protein, PAAT family n=2 Tax=Bosea lathyri TaxID=1036778 RepID=A0A1H5W4Z9_9HYPH|nr:amino acid ABC transporter substrate-binding protein, PAAT family [Bosea lathyri]
MILRRAMLSFILGASVAAGLVPAALRAQDKFDFSPEQPGRIRAGTNPDAIKAIPQSFKFAEPGVLTVGISPGGPPLGAYATDTRTVVGADPDFAQLIADSLGLKLNLVAIAWADWPLGLTSGKYDAVISNVGVTEQRKEKFDFSTYRLGLHGFFVRTDSKIAAIKEPADAAGLRIILGPGTNQERILLEWNKQNVAAGLKPLELHYFDDEASRLLALASGRADVIVQPHAQLVFFAARDQNLKKVGTLSAGWPLKSDVAITTKKGNGLVDALTLATNTLIGNGKYRQSLARWGIEAEAVALSETNPPGLPRL